MIAKNFLKFPEALAHQLCLDFGAMVRWATRRPGSRILRAIRAQRAAAARTLPFVRPDFPPICIQDEPPAPAWWIGARQRARSLAQRIHAACLTLSD